MKYLKKFNENFSAINENAELPQEVKDALANAVKQLSPEELEALKKQFTGVTPEKIEDAVEKAQDQVQGASEAPTNENLLKKAGSFLSKHKGTIGATLLVAGLAGLGIKGEQASHLTDILKDNQVINVLKDPVWIASAISVLSGLVMAGTAAKQGFAKAGADAKVEWEKNMVRKGLAKKDENGVLVSLKTGKPLVYAR